MTRSRSAAIQATEAPLDRLQGWWFSPLPRSRVAWLRTILYAFIIIDVLWLRTWVSDNGLVPSDQYHPLFIARILPFPTPTPFVVSAVKYMLLASATIAASGRLVRVAGAMAFILYLQWMLVAFSYGKVDHDRFAFLVALAVLPTVGKARWRDRSLSESAGFAIRCIQVAVVLTYFLAAFAKFRFGGFDWVNGATLLRAVLRRGTGMAGPLESLPWVLRISQYLIVAFELASPLMLVRGRVGRLYLILALSFHVVTYAMIEIMFWPHVVCLVSFIALERLPDLSVRRSGILGRRILPVSNRH